MPDPRFFETAGPISLARLAELTGAQVANPDTAGLLIACAAPLAAAGPDAVSFLSDKRRAADLAATKAGACFLHPAQAGQAPEGCAVLVSSHPHAAWAAAALALHTPRVHEAGPAIHPSAQLEEGVVVCAGAVIGPGARIGRGTHIGPGAVIGPGVAIGRDGAIGPHASIGFALIGDRVNILAGGRIGESGFGVTVGPSGAVDIPQLGRVILQDSVTIGAVSCVDRGTFDDTVIGENTKIDNLVHVGHNVRIGRNCMLAAYTGISGSTVVGDGVAFGGKAGVADHLTIGDGAQLAAAAALMRDVPAGEVWGGFPARPIRQWLRETAWLARSVNARSKGD